MGHPDEAEWLAEAAEEEWFDQRLAELSEGPVIAYLSRYGDAIQTRVDAHLDEARRLIDRGFANGSFISAVVGLEITIRYFLATPLVQGAFLSEEWATILTAQIFRSRTYNQRELLPAILARWGIDIETVCIRPGVQLWSSITKQVWPLRNAYLHSGKALELPDSRFAVNCLEELLAHVVVPVARRFGIMRPERPWSEYSYGEEPFRITNNREKSSPF